MTTSNEHNNAPAVPQGAPEINYPALIEAAFAKNRKWTQGTTGCIAFARGTEWFRDQMLAATPTPAPAQEVGLTDEERQQVFKAAESHMEREPNLSWRNAVVDEVIAALREKGGQVMSALDARQHSTIAARGGPYVG